MADAHLDAHIDELSRVAALPDVRPAHPHALIGSHTGYACLLYTSCGDAALKPVAITVMRTSSFMDSSMICP